jgi:predicted dinucleotide-binding enzyme
MIKSIAIFGATDKYASALAESVVSDNIRLLLFSDENQEISDLRNQILSKSPSADIELVFCSAEASWQADIIILALSQDQQKMIAAGIQDFVTQKILIAYVDSAQEALNKTKSGGLKDLLPNAHVISIHMAYDQHQQIIFNAGGSNQEALNEAKSLLILAGFIPEGSQPLITL